MDMFTLRLECEAQDAAEDRLVADFSEIADALYDVPGIIDPDLDLDTASRRLVFTMLVRAPNEADAMVAAVTAARTALHAAGKGTPGWEEYYRMTRQDVERRQDTAART